MNEEREHPESCASQLCFMEMFSLFYEQRT